MPGGLGFVPYLHANQSTIESLFFDLSGQLKLSQKYKSHSAEHVGAGNVTLYNCPPNLTLGPKDRQSWIVEQLKKWNLPVSLFDNSKSVNMFPSTVMFDDITVKIINVIGRQEVGDSNIPLGL